MSNPRANFVPIVDRPTLELPHDARVGVILIVNVEQKPLDHPQGSPLSRQAPGSELLPEVPEFSRFEYGLRVGIWRILEATTRLGIRPSMTLNGSVCDTYPRVVEAAVDASWDAVAHGYHQRPLNKEPDERAVIRQTLDAIERGTGSRPLGWLGPGLIETHQTPDLLVEEGVKFVMDWVNDDQPYDLMTPHGPLVAVPYSNEMNDIPVYLRAGQPAGALRDMALDALNTLIHDVPSTARFLPVAVHPFIVGQPHRFGQFVDMIEQLKAHPNVVFMTATEVYHWHEANRGRV